MKLDRVHRLLITSKPTAPKRLLALLSLCMLMAGLTIVPHAPASAAVTDCTTEAYSTPALAKANYNKDCGQPFQETTDFRCDWTSAGWKCTGPGSPIVNPRPPVVEPKINCVERANLRGGVVGVGVPSTDMEPFDDVVVDAILDPANPATTASLAVMRDGRLIYSRAYSAAGTAATNPDSVFRIASISKPITATAIMTLVESGDVRLNDPIVDHIDWAAAVDPRIGNITVEHLLRHQGGWDRSVSGDVMFKHVEVANAASKSPGDLTPRDYVDFMATVNLDFTPGSDFGYSNFGYLLLGEIIEEVTGQPYETYVRQQVFKPLGITDTHLAATSQADSASNEVIYTGAAYDNFIIEPMKAHGGWVMSAKDVARFGNFVANGRADSVLSDVSVDAMFDPAAGAPSAASFYGLGWSVRPVGSSQNTWHTGSLNGGTTSLMINSSNGTSWVLLLNGRSDSGDLDRALSAASRSVSTWPITDLEPICG